MNKIYQTFWDCNLGRWIVMSELGKTRSSSRTLLSVSLVTLLGLGNLAFACTASNETELRIALDSACTSIDLTKDITLTRDILAKITNDVTINGNNGKDFYKLETGGHNITLSGGNANTSYNVIFDGFQAISSTESSSNAAIKITDANSNINLKFDNITSLSDSSLALLSQDYSAGSGHQNQYSEVSIGNISDPVDFKATIYKQFVNGAKIRFTGTMVLNGTGADDPYSYIFWSNRKDSQNHINFDSGSDVTIILDDKVKLSTGGGSGTGTGYAYHFADGSKFTLQSSQNIFGVTSVNRGVVIGSYDIANNTWGSGAVIKIAGVNDDSLAGDGLTNNGGDALGIDNGANGAADVVFNLAQGSSFKVKGTGIKVVKNNNTGIYVRNDATINSENGISIAHNGAGKAVLANHGLIISTKTGIELLSSSNNTIELDQIDELEKTDGEIRASSGSAIRVGSSTTNTSLVNTNIRGGILNLSSDANGIDFASVGAGTNQTVTGVTINLDNTAAMGHAFLVNAANPTAVTLNNTHISLYNGFGFNSLNGFTFEGTNGETNSVTIKGNGYGANTSTNLDALENAHLTITVESADGTGIRVVGGATTDNINITKNIANKIIAGTATAIEVAGAVGRQVDISSDATVNGGIKFTNGAVNNILNLQKDSAITGAVTFGNGDNTVNVLGENIEVSSITMGSGNDTVKIENVTSEKALLLGVIDAGTGNNIFNLTNSHVVMGEDAVFSKFSNYGLTDTTLTLQSNDTITTGTINISEKSTLALNENYQGDLSANLSSSGTLAVLEGANVNLTGNYTGFSGGLKIDGLLKLNNLNTLNNTVKSGSGTLVIDNSDTNNTNKVFNFTKNKVAVDFNGTFDLVGTNFSLVDDNTSALTNSTLKVSTGTVVTVGEGQQNIGGLAFNGGQVNFHNLSVSTGLFVSDSTIKANALDLSGAGKVSVNIGTILDTFDPNGDPTNKISVFEMDDDNLIVQLATGTTVTGTAANLTLIDEKGDVIQGKTVMKDFINSNNVKNAEGTFDFRLAGTEKGLYVNYGLTTLNLLGKGVGAFDLTLSGDDNNGNRKNDLSAQIIGLGDLQINAQNGAIISLSNSSNSYSGDTLVDQGTLSLAVDSALGNTNQLKLAGNTTVLINDTAQTINTINSVTGSNIQFTDGQLTIKTGGEISGNLTGKASIGILEGNLNIKSSNTDLSGTVAIGQTSGNAAIVTVNQNNGLGSSVITLNELGALNYENANGALNNVIRGNGSLTLTNSSLSLTKDSSNFAGNIVIDKDSQLSASSVNQFGDGSSTNTITNDGNLTFTATSNNYTEILKNSINGTGDFVKNGAGVLVFGKSTQLNYQGQTDINEGTLYLDGATIQSSKQVTIAEHAILQGYGEIGGSVENNGTLHVDDRNSIANRIARAGTTGTTLTIQKDLVNNGHIILQEKAKTVANNLNIIGNYIGGAGSNITLATKLGIDNATSNIPQLMIGGNATGSTSLVIKNTSGNGGQTVNEGILLIDVQGTSDNDAFVLSNTVMDGAYEYTLHKGIDNNSWYLHSFDTYRPDYGNNLANILSIIDQQGNQTIGNVVGGSGGIRSSGRLRSGNQDKLSSIWNITTYGKKQGHTASKQINYDYETKNTLFGADTGLFVGDGLLQVGGMVGLVKTTSNSHNIITDSRGTGEVKGNQYSIYGTWYFDADTALSPFVDFIVSYGRYKNKINTKGNDQSSYRSHLYTYTLQGGYPIQLGENLIVEPQAQLTYVDYKIKDYTDHTGTTVKQSVDGKVRSRIGAYIYPNDADFRPYAAVNLWYDDLSAKAGYSDIYLKSDKRKMLIEGKLGLEANLSEDFSLSAEANYIRGRNQYKDYSVRIGLKYRF